MNISLSPEWESWIQQQIALGSYQSASELIRDALLILREQNQLRELRQAELQRQLSIGLEQLERGEGEPLSSEVLADIKRRGREKLGLPHT